MRGASHSMECTSYLVIFCVLSPMSTSLSASEQLLSFILGAAVVHGGYIGGLLLAKNGKEKRLQWLAVGMFGMSLYLSNYLLFLTRLMEAFPHLLGILGIAVYVVGPALYLFVRYSLSPTFQLSPLDGLHLLPLVYPIWKSIQIVQWEVSEKLYVIELLLHPRKEMYSWWDIILGSQMSYWMLGYLVLAYAMCHRVLQTPPSFEADGGIRWLQKFCLGGILLILLDLAIKFISFGLDVPGFVMEYLLAAVMSVGIHIAGYVALGKLPNLKAHRKKYQTSPLNAKQIQQHQQRLLQLMEEQQPWLRPQLKLTDLASLMNIPPHHLSQVLNAGLKTNYAHFINQYRVEEVKRRLIHPDYQHYSILAIGLDCGFQTKTNFNRVFKNLAGMSPSAYMREQQQGGEEF